MKYYFPIDITKWQLILDKFKNIELPKTELSIVLSSFEKLWLAEQILPDIKALTKKDHQITIAIIFIQPPKMVGNIHVDGIRADRLGHPNWSLNIPLTNTQATMSWYTGEYKINLKTDDKVTNLPYLILDWNNSPVVADTALIDSPVIVHIGTPHSVVNQSDQTRMILSVRFSPDLFE
jgi:hypothetical protein